MKKAGLVFLLVALLAPCTSVYAVDETKGYLVVVHPENPVATLTHEFVEQVFLVKQTTWADGVLVDVVLNASEEIAGAFYPDIIEKTPGQYLIYRKKLLFNGIAIPPKSMRDDEEVILYIAQHPNSIGFVSPGSLDWRVKPITISNPSD